jgi:hypothetical protein
VSPIVFSSSVHEFESRWGYNELSIARFSRPAVLSERSESKDVAGSIEKPIWKRVGFLVFG